MIGSGFNEDDYRALLDELRHEQSLLRERMRETEHALAASEQRCQQLIGQEQALRASEQACRKLFDAGVDADKFRTLIETTGTGYVILDSGGKVIDANQEYVRLTGHTDLSEIEGRSVVEWTAPEDRERNAIEVAKCLEHCAVRDLEIHYLTPKNERTPIEINATAVGDGPSRRIVTICRDISERKRMQDAQRRSDARLRAIVETTQEWIWAMDLAGHHIYSNQALNEILGYSPREVIGVPFERLMHPEDLPKVQTLVATSIATRQGWSGIVVRFRHKDESYRYLESNAVPLFDEQGILIGFQGADRDITERERTQQALRESEERFRSAFEQAAVGLAHVSPDGHFLRINQRLCNIVGYSHDEMLALTFQDITFAEDLDWDVNEAQNLLTQRTGRYSGEKRYVRKDGSLVWANLTVSLHRQADGSIDYFISVVEDITERKCAEHALRFTQFAVDNAADAVFWIDREARFIYVNQSACTSLGYTKGELLELSLSDVAPNLSTEEWPTRFQRLCELGTLVYESLHRTKDGQVFPVEITASQVQFEGERYICAFARDITARRHAEHAIRENEERFRALVENNPDVIARFDRDRRFLYVNPAIYTSTGQTPEALLGKTCLELRQPAEPAALLDAMVRRVFESGQEQAFEFDVTTPRGVEYYLSRGVPEFAADGSVVSALFIHRNISDRKRSEEERDRLQAQLLQSQKMDAVGQLAGGIAHDFNNMLTGILGFSELARECLEPSSEAAKHLLDLNQVVSQCKQLTSQILAFSRKQMLTMEVVDWNAVVLSAGKMLRRVIGEKLEIRTQLQPDLPRVRADSSQLQQLLLNLAVNARDAMPNGGTLTIETTSAVLSELATQEPRGLGGGDCVLVTVSDTGCGMDDKTLNRVFEPFFTTKRLGRGTGLGLATVYGIVRQHGGHIDVRSTPGAGTVFRVFLPRIPEKAEVRTLSELPPVSRGSETILVVEDDLLVRDLTVRHLSNYGYRVLSAPGPAEALTLVRQYDGPIDILVADVVLPVMNGRELYTKLVTERPELKILYMSGYPGDTLAEHGGKISQELGFIQKPFSVVELTHRIRRILDGGNRH